MTEEQSNQLQELYDAIIPSVNKKKVVLLGTGNSFNVSSYEGYANFTIDNFIIEATGIYTSGSAQDNLRGSLSMSKSTTNVTKTYNASTGAFSVSTGHSNSAVKTSGDLGFSMSVSGGINIKVWLLI